MDAADLVDGATAARLERGDGESAVQVADLGPGVFGVLRAEVRHVHAVREFTRKDGRPGCLRRVTLGDATGEVDLVLWGDEVHQAVDGPFAAHMAVLLRGATVKPGFRGGVELHLGGAVVEEAPSRPGRTLSGAWAALAPTQVVSAGGTQRFQAEAEIMTDQGPVHVVLWDDAVRAAQDVAQGDLVELPEARPHPLLDGWFTAERLSPVAQPS